jgi:hypothetical protein
MPRPGQVFPSTRPRDVPSTGPVTPSKGASRNAAARTAAGRTTGGQGPPNQRAGFPAGTVWRCEHPFPPASGFRREVGRFPDEHGDRLGRGVPPTDRTTNDFTTGPRTVGRRAGGEWSAAGTARHPSVFGWVRAQPPRLPVREGRTSRGESSRREPVTAGELRRHRGHGPECATTLQMPPGIPGRASEICGDVESGRYSWRFRPKWWNGRGFRSGVWPGWCRAGGPPDVMPPDGSGPGRVAGSEILSVVQFSVRFRGTRAMNSSAYSSNERRTEPAATTTPRKL